MILEKIKGPKDLKKIPINKLPQLANEMREALLNRVSKYGGHVGPNFGDIEATIAIHYVFNSPTDKIIFDVSHQSYPHKMLTGRSLGYLDEKHFKDVSGYTDPSESIHDMFVMGHTSTSISQAIGVAKARDLKGEKYNVIAFIGDGSLSGGEALEGLNACDELHSNLIIILNDNNMCMAENHGGLYKALKELRESNGKCSNNIFKAFGYDYLFVKEGNDVNKLVSSFKKVKDHKSPIVVHICTVKGKGLKFAEQDKEPWHFHQPFNPITGQLLNKPVQSYASILREYLLAKAKKDKKLLVVTSATPMGSGLDKKAREQLGKQFIDVGIAEQTATSVCAGAAKNGAKPFWGITASFLQRSYDQISQDICLNNSPVTIAVLFTGIYSMNDATHLGFFDIPLLCNIPNLVYIAPTTKQEYLKAIEFGLNQNKHPVFVRTPGGKIIEGKECTKDFSKINKYELVQKGSKVAIIGVGNFFELAKQTANLYYKLYNKKLTLINPYFVSGIDESLLNSIKKNHNIVITLEDGVLDGGFGLKISRYYSSSNVKVINYGLRKEFLDRYDVNKIIRTNRLTPGLICEDINKMLEITLMIK